MKKAKDFFSAVFVVAGLLALTALAYWLWLGICQTRRNR
jgi:hypothetical protein